MSVTAIRTTSVGAHMQALTLRLRDETFAIEATIVREILDLVPITRVPNAPAFVFGLVNMRGTVVPLVDLRVAFGMDRPPPEKSTRIVVVEVDVEGEPLTTGLLADAVHEVVEIDEDAFEPVPKVGTRWPPGFVRRIGKLGDTFIVVPDLEQIFHAELKTEIRTRTSDERPLQ